MLSCGKEGARGRRRELDQRVPGPEQGVPSEAGGKARGQVNVQKLIEIQYAQDHAPSHDPQGPRPGHTEENATCTTKIGGGGAAEHIWLQAPAPAIAHQLLHVQQYCHQESQRRAVRSVIPTNKEKEGSRHAKHDEATLGIARRAE